VLNRVPASAKPVASFACEKASTIVEKTICESISLAAFDRSVAESYAYATRQFREFQNPKALHQLTMQQKKWLGRRNHCGANANCLQHAMETRLEEIDSMQRGE
jgi:uncharacterized protein